MLVLVNILGFIAIFLLGAGLWVLLCSLTVVLLTLALVAVERDTGADPTLSADAIDRLLREIEDSKRIIDSIDGEISAIKRAGGFECKASPDRG